ncbi:MAG: hypothetical protein ABF649_13755, partial [Bacillus sp. (in: firmicutes)]
RIFAKQKRTGRFLPGFSYLEPYLNELTISVEELISIVYLDFISSIAQQGNSTKIQSSIVHSLKK